MSPQHSVSHRLGMLVLVGLFALLCMLFGSPAAAQTPAPPAAGAALAPASAADSSRL